MDKKRNIWNDNEVEGMLSIIQEKQIMEMLDNKTKRNKNVFEEVARDMAQKGCLRTGDQVKAKFKALKCDFYKAKRNNNKSGAQRQTCQYFHILNELLGKRPALTSKGADTSDVNDFETYTEEVLLPQLDEENDIGLQNNSNSSSNFASQSTAASQSSATLQSTASSQSSANSPQLRSTTHNTFKKANTSPQPFGIYRVPPDLTPSPQPLSPTNAYTHNIALVSQGNQQIILANQQYNTNNVGQQLMDISDYNALSHQQQQYNGSNFGSVGATHWETKYNPAATVNNNLSNLNNTNTFTMHNFLIPVTTGQSQENYANRIGNNWNLPANNSNHLQQQQQEYQQHTTPNDIKNSASGPASNGNNDTSGNNNTNDNNDSNTNYSNNEHGLSNLLTFDSEQLIRINSEDQQMLRLNSEDLQLSNLSIST